jgi:hypothetical protein
MGAYGRTIEVTKILDDWKAERSEILNEAYFKVRFKVRFHYSIIDLGIATEIHCCQKIVPLPRHVGINAIWKYIYLDLRE